MRNLPRSIRRIVLSLATVVGLSGPLVVGAAALEWGNNQRDSGHSGYEPSWILPEKTEHAWGLQSDTPLNPVPEVAGRAFIVEAGGGPVWPRLRAVRASSGEALWSIELTGALHVDPPAAGGEWVVVRTLDGSSDDVLTAFRADTGAQVFSSRSGKSVRHYYAPVVMSDAIYAVRAGDQLPNTSVLYAYDPRDGHVLWQAALPDAGMWTPAVDAGNVYAYVGGQVYVFDRLKGRELYRIDDPGFNTFDGDLRQAPVVVAGRLYVINAGRLVCFDLAARTMAWSISNQFRGQPVTDGTTVYAVDDNRVTAYWAATGGFLWAWAPPAGTLRDTFLVTTKSLFAATDADTYAVALTSQSIEWSYPTSGDLTLGENLYIAGTHGVAAMSVWRLLDLTADLGITVTPHATDVNINQKIRYDVLVSNAGPSDGFPRIWIEVLGTVGFESMDGSCHYSWLPMVLECTPDLSLAPGQTWPMELVLRALQPGPVTLRASVFGLADENGSTNNQSLVTVTVH